MGAFFTSVQVHSDDLAAVLSALRADAREDGFDELGDAEGADRSVIVLPAEAGWISIYDQASEGQDVTVLEQSAERVSAALRTHCVTILVHDSDVLDLRLFRDGARLDEYDSFPDYFGRARKAKTALAGQPAKWRELLVGGTEEDLGNAFAGKPLFAERGLSAIAKLVGLDPRRARTGYRYLLGDGELGTSAPFLGPTMLRFRRRERPAWERAATGPPKLTVQGHPGAPLELAIGDELRVGVSTLSAGGASRGLRVVLWGSAIDGELARIERCEVLIGDVRAGARHRMVETHEARDAQGRVLVVAELEDAEIPAGPEQAGHAAGADFTAFFEAMQARTVHVNVVGRVVQAGASELFVGLTPIANTAGSDAARVALDVSAPLRRPLRAHGLDGMPGGSSHLLRPLAGDAFWVFLAPIDATRADVAALAQTAIEALAVVLPPVRVETAIFAMEAGARPRTGKGRGSTLLQGKRLGTLREAMEREASVSVTAIREERAQGPERMTAPGWTVVMGTGVLPDRMDARVPALAISIERASLDAPTQARAREVLEASLARVITAGALSASITRAGQPITTSVDHTTYEAVCGIHGTVTSTRDWCRRWLRIPGDDVTYLARGLAEHIDAPARQALAGVADLEEGADGSLLVRLRDRSDLDALERGLAAVLPDAASAQAAQRAWVARPTGA